MTLIGPESTCRVCDEELDRPYVVTPYVSPELDARLAPYFGSIIHCDCLALWSERETFARASFLESLASFWTLPRTRLLITAEWFLAAEPAKHGEDPGFVIVGLARWPFLLHSPWSDWPTWVEGGYRRPLAGPALTGADAVMTEIRELAPSIDALRMLLDGDGVHDGGRSLVDLGRYLATLSADVAGGIDWQQLEDFRRAEREAVAERDGQRNAEILRSNELADRLRAELETGTPLRCPHCRRRSREMRFVEGRPHDWSYFICKQCGCSFAGAEALRRGSMPWRRPK